MKNDGIGLTVLNDATQQPVIYVGTAATLDFTLTNQTGGDVTFNPASPGPASVLEIYFPAWFQLAELQAMSISLAGWTFAVSSTLQALTLTWAGSAASTWASGDTLTFQVTGVLSSATATVWTAQVSFAGLGGAVPAQSTATLTLSNPPQQGNADLPLQVWLDNQGLVYVSDADDPLQNTLTLNFTNAGAAPLYTGSSSWGGTPQVTVAFVYGSTSGALEPLQAASPNAGQATSSSTGSAWSIVAQPLYGATGWSVQNPTPSGAMPSPVWTLQPTNTNLQILGTGDAASVSFSFTNVVSFTVPGVTQMTVQFSGFMQDEQTAYNDACFVLDIVKQEAPPTRGLVNFFSTTPTLTVTDPTQPVPPISLNWAMFDVAQVTRLTSYPGINPVTTTYPNPPTLNYDTATVTLPGVTQSTAVTFTLQAYAGGGGYLNSMQFTVFVSAQMFVDPRDGQVYPVVQLGSQVWMAGNLNYTAPSGSAPYAGQASEQAAYGLLYTQQAAGTGTLPPGWRLPSQADWNTLLNAYSYADLAVGGSSGFNAQLGGYTDDFGNSTQMGSYGYYWSSTPSGNGSVYAGFSGTSLSTSAGQNFPDSYLLSVRYVQDVS